MKRRLLGCFPHLSVIWSVMLLTFLVTDQFNTAMAFVNHSMTKRLLALYLLCNLSCILQLLLQKEGGMKIARWILGIGTALLMIAAGTLLIVDHIDPARLLFTMDSVKGVLALMTVSALSASVLLIICQRRAFASL